MMIDWEDQGIETEYKLITDPREYLEYIIAEYNNYNNELKFHNYNSENFKIASLKSLNKDGYWYKLIFGFNIFKIKGTQNIQFDSPDVIKYSTKLKECYDEVYNRILTAFNPKDKQRSVFNTLDGEWYKINKKS